MHEKWTVQKVETRIATPSTLYPQDRSLLVQWSLDRPLSCDPPLGSQLYFTEDELRYLVPNE